MGKYAADREALASLVGEAEVHRDVYVDDEVFALEMRHLFANTWVYVGHESEAPSPGDFVTPTSGPGPSSWCAGEDGAVRVLHNRCPHKGTRLVTERSGNTGRHLRCPYHAWTFRTDGGVYAIPLRRGYDGTGLEGRAAVRGIARVGAEHVYRGFVFARMSETGIGFDEYFGESLSSLDNMVDRSPAGRLEVAGPPLRYLHRCNWKMLVENQTDACHPMVAHESSAGDRGSGSGRRCKSPRARRNRWRWRSSPPSCRATSSSRRWGSGCGRTATATPGSTIPSTRTTPRCPATSSAWRRPGARSARARSSVRTRHNTVYFPNTMVKGPIQLLRRFQPISADRTLVERLRLPARGPPPDLLLERTVMYNRLINAPTSIVGHDDLEIYERMQSASSPTGSSG